MGLRFQSLTALFGLLFSAVAMLTFAAVGMYLYHSLATELETQEEAGLIEKVKYIRHLLEETPSSDAIRRDPHRFVDAATGHDGLYLRLQSADGKVLMQNHSNWATLPALPVAPVQSLPARSSLRQWAVKPDLSARTVAAWGVTAGPEKEPVQITLAHSRSAMDGLLASYRAKVLTATLAGALLAGLLGYMLVRQAHSITAERLDTRLDAATVPRELQIIVESFNAMLDRLHDSFQRLTQFSADLAHDFRTPINNLMVQTQVALSHPRTIEDYQVLLASNTEEYERLARMIESMLFLARADHARIALNKQLLKADAELQHIADYFEGIADDARIHLTVQANGLLSADATLLRRAVNNLVANAIRHTPQGGSVQLHGAELNDATEIAVINSGSEIDPLDMPRLFDRFYRADRARSDSASSTGLGLAIVQSIMKLHGGRAEVDSANNLTTFRLLFPKA